MNKWLKYVLPFLLVGVIGFFLFSGYLIGSHNFPPSNMLRKVEVKFLGHYFDQVSDPEITPEYYDSIFLRLYSSETSLKDRLSRNGRGGGITSFGDAVLLLTYDGLVFGARSAEEVILTNLKVPDNGFSAYQRAAETDKFKELNHNFGLFRYNDIKFYESDEKRGFAISYTEYDSTDNCYRNTVATLPVAPSVNNIEQLSTERSDWEIVFRSQPCLPQKKINYAIEGGLAGGRIAFQAPTTIFLGSGDYHWDGIYAPKAIAQDPSVDYGKIISIDIETKQNRIVSTGIRNPQGIVFDRDGDLWMVEHGLRGGDELNHIEEGINYGWPVETLGTQYSKLPLPNSLSYGRHDTYREPVFAWLPSVAISNLTLVDGFHESWDGDLLMGSLKSMSLFHIRIKDGRVLFTEQIDIGERIRYVHQHTDGRLVLWTDSKKLIFLTGKPFQDNYINDYLATAIADEELRGRIKTSIDACRQCHSIEPGDHTNAPSLALIYDSEIGTTDYPNYSGALKQKSEVWTPENLKAFLKDPDSFAPGTLMPDPGIDDEAALDELVKLIRALGSRDPGELTR